MSEQQFSQPPRFCRHCGEPLPPTNPRFCIECGGEVWRPNQPSVSTVIPTPPAPAATARQDSVGMPTVQLANARQAQVVVGGTIRLPTAHASPPGLWFPPYLPTTEDTLAVYVPLRAVVGGWSGLIGKGWRRIDESDDGTTERRNFRFESERDWFPAPNGAEGLQLRVHIHAESHSYDGRQRRGFRYRVGQDAPMEVAEAWWLDPRTKRRLDRPIPQIQLMAPPRIPRISDYDEAMVMLSVAEATAWVAGSAIKDSLILLHTNQQRTAFGRGLPLAIPGMLARFRYRLNTNAFIRTERPFVCRWSDWPRQKKQIQSEATDLGLDLGTDAVIEWWLDRHNYDSAIIEGARQLYDHERVVIAFRRAQIGLIEK